MFPLKSLTVKLGKTSISFLEIDVCTEASSLLGLCVFGEGDEGGCERLGSCLHLDQQGTHQRRNVELMADAKKSDASIEKGGLSLLASLMLC